MSFVVLLICTLSLVLMAGSVLKKRKQVNVRDEYKVVWPGPSMDSVVMINGSSFTHATMRCGVPQGS